MWLFPYTRFTIITNLKSDEAIQRLSGNVNPPPTYRWFRHPISNSKFKRYFYGNENGNVFKIYRAIVKGRNSFIPFIKCEIKDSDVGAKVLVRMKLHPVVLTFCLWILIICFFSRSTFGHIVFTYETPGLFFFLAVYGMALFSFLYDAKKDKETLLTIFDGEIAS
jgi:hypothetical protein